MYCLFNFKLTVGLYSSVSCIFSHYILHYFLGQTIFLSYTWNRTLGKQTIKWREFLTALAFLDITWSYPRYIESFEVINSKKILRLCFNIHCTYSILIHCFFFHISLFFKEENTNLIQFFIQNALLRTENERISIRIRHCSVFFMDRTSIVKFTTHSSGMLCSASFAKIVILQNFIRRLGDFLMITILFETQWTEQSQKRTAQYWPYDHNKRLFFLKFERVNIVWNNKQELEVKFPRNFSHWKRNSLFL